MILKRWSMSCILLVGLTISVFGSQLVPFELEKLEPLADAIIIGKVLRVEKDSSQRIPEVITGYDKVVLQVTSVLKGKMQGNEVVILLATRGNRAFDPVVKVSDTGVFFLKANADGTMRTAYPGSIGLFPKGHFVVPPKNIDEQSPANDSRTTEE